MLLRQINHLLSLVLQHIIYRGILQLQALTSSKRCLCMESKDGAKMYTAHLDGPWSKLLWWLLNTRLI